MLTGVLLIFPEKLLDLVTDLAVWHFDIILGVTVIGHQGQEIIIGNVELRDFLATSEEKRNIRFNCGF